MGITLSGQHVAALCDTAAVLLAPLDAADAAEWRADVARAFRRAFEADAAFVADAADGGTPAVAWDGLGLGASAAAARCCALTPDGVRIVDPDADVNRSFAGLRAGAWSTELLDEWTGRLFRRSRMYREAWVEGADVRSGAGLARDGRGLVTDVVGVGYRGTAPGGFGEANADVCALLLPAFLAGTAALRRLGALRAGARAYADALSLGALVLDGRGRELYRNRALVSMLTRDPDCDAVLARMRDAARGTRGLVGALGARAAARVEAGTFKAPDARVPSRGGPYRARACLLPQHESGAGATVVTLERRAAWGRQHPPGAFGAAAPPVPPAAEDAQPADARFTSREAAVAGLLAERRTNREIADALGISPHTARHYTESVLAKLGVRSRRAVGHLLLRPARTADARRAGALTAASPIASPRPHG